MEDKTDFTPITPTDASLNGEYHAPSANTTDASDASASATDASPASMQSCGPAYAGRPAQPSPYSIPAYTPKPKTVYSVREAVFAFFSLVFGYLFADIILFADRPERVSLGASVLVFAFAAYVGVYAVISKAKLCTRSVVTFVLLILTGTSMLIFADPLLCILTFLFDMALGMYWMFVTLGASNSDRLDFLAYAEAFKAGLVLPFANLGRGFAAFFSVLTGKKLGEKKSNDLLYAVIGVIVAIVPLVIVVNALLADEAFRTVWTDVIRIPDWDVGDILLRLVLAIPVGCYLFGGLIGASRFPRHDLMTAESVRHAAQTFRFVPAVTASTVMIPLCLVYVIYFFSQSAYFVSAFAGVLPDGFTYAEYARSGFFELCFVAVVNLAVIGGAEFLARRDNGRKGRSIPICTSVLALFTVVLMVIAQSKLILYIRTYGMTELRVTTFWFTVVLGVIFALVMIYQFAPGMNFTRAAAVSLAVLLCGLIFADTDAMIARYNIAQYREGTVKNLDAATLCDLGDGAVPYLAEVYEELPDDGTRRIVERTLTERAEESDERSIWEWSIASSKADDAVARWCEKYGINVE